MNLGKTEILLIIVGIFVLMLLVGGKKIPDMARSITKTRKNIHDGLHDKEKDDDKTK